MAKPKGWMKEVKANTNTINQNTVNKLKAKEAFSIDYIDVNDIEINEHNFYNVDEIEELAKDIEVNGLCHNLVVNRIGDNKYKLISGERRYKAICLLNEKGVENLKQIPCKIVEVNEIDAEIMLIQTNALARELSDIEKLQQVEILKELYKEKKKKGGYIKGSIYEKISEILNISTSQVNKYNAISKGSEVLKEAFKENEITMRDASSVARLEEEGQKLAMDILKNAQKEVVVDELKKEIKLIEKEKKEKEKEGEKEKEVIEEEYKQNLDNLKKSYVEVSTSKQIKTKDLTKKINKAIKTIENIISEISCLDEIDDNITQKAVELEQIAKGVVDEIELLEKVEK